MIYIESLFEHHFNSKQPAWLLEQELWNCNETIADIGGLIKLISLHKIKDRGRRWQHLSEDYQQLFVYPSCSAEPLTWEDTAKLARLAQEALSMSNPDSDKLLSVIQGQNKIIKELTKAVTELQVQTVTFPGVSVRKMYEQTCQLCNRKGHSAHECRIYYFAALFFGMKIAKSPRFRIFRPETVLWCVK